MREGTDHWQTKGRSLLHLSDGIVELLVENTLEVGWDCEELVYGTVRHPVMQKRVRYVSFESGGLLLASDVPASSTIGRCQRLARFTH